VRRLNRSGHPFLNLRSVLPKVRPELDQVVPERALLGNDLRRDLDQVVPPRQVRRAVLARLATLLARDRGQPGCHAVDAGADRPVHQV